VKVLRTPDSAFAAISDFPFASNYVEIADPSDGTPLRIHYVDEGPRDAPVVLMMHGEPSWCYLYRHMIGPVVAAGFRVIAPDLIGFGKSDKPTKKSDYSYARHVGWMRQWVEALDLTRMTLVCQDWGSLIGLRLVAEMPDRFASVVLSNGGLPEGGPPTARLCPVAGLFPMEPGLPDRPDHQRRGQARAQRGRDCRLRRAISGQQLQGRCAHLPQFRAVREQCRHPGPEARVAGVRPVGQALPVLLQRRRSGDPGR
jgi:pimeloyl-ACP methyl ester carboxylesterase